MIQNISEVVLHIFLNTCTGLSKQVSCHHPYMYMICIFYDNYPLKIYMF